MASGLETAQDYYYLSMEIDVIAGAVNTLKKNGYKILQDQSFARTLLSYGIEQLVPNDPTKAKHTETTQRFRLRLITTAGDELPTKVEFSRRTNTAQPVTELIDPEITRTYQRLAFRVQHYSGKDAAIQKVEALAGRNETQTRDVFDLYLLFCAGHTARISKLCPKDTIEKALQNLSTLEFSQFQGQVLEYLSKLKTQSEIGQARTF